ncbi:hypothetical protein J3R73_001607 [Labrys monachus]|uniref:Uncharacterized protein n=1 Tax=Labrys monachus TaxID=217067 RepID=A0ABU0FCN1_9HYPH|nr:hypothetical protein [Labrys monachus]
MAATGAVSAGRMPSSSRGISRRCTGAGIRHQDQMAPFPWREIFGTLGVKQLTTTPKATAVSLQ